MHLVHNTVGDQLVISHVSSEYRGDFSTMMDTVTEELEAFDIKFTMVINDNLKETLHGFEEKTEFFEPLGEEMTVLEGRWMA
ncbi:MAG: hypothetical protein BRD29_02325 [Bacteroidetes bacterium QH_2_67_10]|nr:MAG: hypothetical protein BRD29_02325 [Bacteroidetes bacterium QH_2_67_10]